jgi:hypothetical protein
MPRRIYTYHGGLGWEPTQLAATIGAYTLAASIILVVANFAWSRFAGVVAGPNPWGAGTLEWTTTSPPLEFNYPVVPVVRSSYPAWDIAGMEEDQRRLEAGNLVLDEGEEQPATTVLDADIDEVLKMPSNSAAPLTLALSLAAVFTMLLLSHFIAAGVFGAFALAVIGYWHSKEPQAG